MVVSAVPGLETTGGRIPSPREGFLAPDFSLELLDGGTLTLSDLRGETVLVNLWATWCPPCRAEMPAIQEVFEANKDRGFEVVAVNMTFQDREAEVAAFVEQLGLSFPVALDRSGEVARLYLMRALPTTFFIDREGDIHKVIVGGPMSEITLRTTVEDLLGNAE
ncbi:MAG: redoxin domain-containing protein [Anaerolineales bacterium]|nr:redoxin domain-containing protein [Anaerolineales bacterium]